jgi:hypothetical protein
MFYFWVMWFKLKSQIKLFVNSNGIEFELEKKFVSISLASFELKINWIELFVNFKRAKLELKNKFLPNSSQVWNKTNSYPVKSTSNKFGSTYFQPYNHPTIHVIHPNAHPSKGVHGLGKSGRPGQIHPI